MSRKPAIRPEPASGAADRLELAALERKQPMGKRRAVNPLAVCYARTMKELKLAERRMKKDMAGKNPRLGSTLESLLREDGSYADMKNQAIKAVLAYKLAEAKDHRPE